MNVVGIDRQFQDMPAMPGAPGFKELATISSNCAGEDRFASFRGPNQVIDNQVDSMFVALIFHSIPVLMKLAAV